MSTQLETKKSNEQEVECYLFYEMEHKTWLYSTIRRYICNSQGNLATVCVSIRNNLFCYKFRLAAVTSKNFPECKNYTKGK